jgi:glycosyltransferase involved in cell wall biosynthesis
MKFEVRTEILFQSWRRDMNKIDSISVIVPTFNRMDFLEETLKAILLQEVQDLEIIVVDDCSTDKTKEFLINFAQLNAQVRPIFLDSNQGESSAVNAGWKETTKKFIAIVNSDDPPHKDWLRAMFQGIHANPTYGFFYPDRLVINQSGEPLRYEKLENWSTQTLFGILIPIASAGLIIDKTCLPVDFLPRDPNIVFPSDLIQMFELGLIAEGCRIEGAWGVWREHSDSFSSAVDSETKASLFEIHVRSWLYKHIDDIAPLANPFLSEASLYGHLWRIFRKKSSFMRSNILLLKTSLLPSIRKRPKLVIYIVHIAIRYGLKNLYRPPSRFFK